MLPNSHFPAVPNPNILNLEVTTKQKILLIFLIPQNIVDRRKAVAEAAGSSQRHARLYNLRLKVSDLLEPLKVCLEVP